jgi:hypothetical protein
MKVKNKKIKSAGTPTQASPIDEKEGNVQLHTIEQFKG